MIISADTIQPALHVKWYVLLQIKRPEISSGLFLFLFHKAFYVSSNFQTGNSTCLSRHSSMFQQRNRKRLRYNNNRILLQTYCFFSFYLFYSCFHLLIIPPIFPGGSHCEAHSSSLIDQSQASSSAFEVQDKTTFCIRSKIPDRFKIITIYCQSN